ncbi:MAG: tyrosine-protein phosphatase [Bacteroidales bacterium]|nr:tyrosine-protein phosphatase [Bacteroidales bacterium]
MMTVLSRCLLPTTRTPWGYVRQGLKLGLWVLLAVGVVETVRVLAFLNLHAVIPGRVYRSAQPDAEDLQELATRYGIKTVINLRGMARDGDPNAHWYFTEAGANHDLNIAQEDITLSAARLPPPKELRRLIEVLDRTEYPILFHCKSGADRTGLTATIVRLLYTDDSLDAARWQLLPRYGHFNFGRTAAIDQFFDLYEQWLQTQNATHRPERFRQWAANVYTPGPAQSELIWLDSIPNPIPADQGFAVRLRAINRSNEPWELKPGDHAGIHLSYLVARGPTEAAYRGKAGLFRATIPPGGHVDLTLAVPPLKIPGTYALAAELTDARGSGVPIRSYSFVQFGDSATLAEVIVK